jgi:hypothetical protein
MVLLLILDPVPHGHAHNFVPISHACLSLWSMHIACTMMGVWSRDVIVCDNLVATALM